jgi:GIY-YIG catalytic domain-containing protein
MEINIEELLRDRCLIPLTNDEWNPFEITHHPTVNLADGDYLIEKIRASIPRGTGGVYIYEDINGDVIYVGKSADLRDRFRTHYRRANRRDPSGDRNDRHFNFWSARCGKLVVYWHRIDREVDRQIVEIMLTFYLQPKFVNVPRTPRKRRIR